MRSYKDRYKLELHWDSLAYKGSGLAVIKGAYFSGPVLKLAGRINSPDFIDLDLTPQLLAVLNSYYVVRLSWGSVEYKEDKVFLYGSEIKNDYLETVHKFTDKDYLIINTEKHEEKTHPYHLLYEATVFRADKRPYNYSE